MSSRLALAMTTRHMALLTEIDKANECLLKTYPIRLYHDRQVEVITDPWSTDGGGTWIGIRLVPGDPTTMTTVLFGELSEAVS